MKNRVGSSLPSQQTTDSIKNHITAVVEDAKPYTVALTTEERMRTTKFRPGGERIVELIAQLVSDYSVSLPGLSVADMNTDLGLSKQFRPLATQAQSMADTLSDTVLQAESECWWAATAYYSALTRIADNDVKLAEALRPAVDFFATGRRTKKTTPTTND